MPDKHLPKPGLIWGHFPEKPQPTSDNRRLNGINTCVRRLTWHRLNRYRHIAKRSQTLETSLSTLSPTAFADKLREHKCRLTAEGLSTENIVTAFALFGHACQQRLGIRLYDSQRIAAASMLDGHLAEMATGEGKTLAIALAAASAALAGVPVHVLTANDYLVKRDAVYLKPVFTLLGLSVGAIQQAQDGNRRRRQYACDITYCTAKELVFDYLRDQPLRIRYQNELAWHVAQLTTEPNQATPLQRGLCMAIIDEADNILLDEANVPLIIAETAENQDMHEAMRQILSVANRLAPDSDFQINGQAMTVQLTDSGRDQLEQEIHDLHQAWHNRRHREEALCLALAALHLYQRDSHYIVADNRLHLVDATTGRLAPGRVWSRGLQQYVELKECCSLSSETVTRAQISYQRFFPRYHRLCGMSGTLWEASAELIGVYGLSVLRVPLRKPDLRRHLGLRLFLNKDHLWQAVSERILELTRSGRPVLIGTDSIADSESLSAHLSRLGIAHQVLNARHDRQEAAIVAQAGQAGQVTVTTNMAGRGTDIPLSAEVAQRGGLHVISCQFNGIRRIDRQLQGRCARQGDPGSTETLLSLDAPLLRQHLPKWLLHIFEKRLRAENAKIADWFARALVRCCILLNESRQRSLREALLQQDRQLQRQALFND